MSCSNLLELYNRFLLYEILSASDIHVSTIKQCDKIMSLIAVISTWDTKTFLLNSSSSLMENLALLNLQSNHLLKNDIHLLPRVWLYLCKSALNPFKYWYFFMTCYYTFLQFSGLPFLNFIEQFWFDFFIWNLSLTLLISYFSWLGNTILSLITKPV